MKRVIELTENGLYCAAGDFYIDPTRKVENAIITHVHSDHARRGSLKYICNDKSLRLLRHRLAKKAEIITKKYGESFEIGRARVSLHPAGHILGSSQVRVQVGKEVWVVSGDYKRDLDPTCDEFEVVKCDTFITEATFALPNYYWEPSNKIISEMVRWRERNKREGVVSVVFCYSVGKAQRIMAELGKYSSDVIYVHPTIEPYVEHYRNSGVSLPLTKSLPESYKGGELVIAPPSADKSWLEDVDYEGAFVSGWMSGGKFGRGFHEGFALSDHADWPALLRTVQDTGAKNVYVTHGYSKVLVKQLRAMGLNAAPLEHLSKTFSENKKKPLLSKLQMTLNSFMQ